MRALAVAFALGGLGIAGFFAWRGPSYTAQPVALVWTPGAPDAGGLTEAAAQGGVRFVTGHDPDEPMLPLAFLVRRDAFAPLDDVSTFHAVEVVAGRWWVLGEREVEGPGPSLELYVSDDQGAHFEHRASVPKPSYLARLERWRFDGETVELELSLDDPTPRRAPWEWGFWPEAWPRSLSPGRARLVSRNAGRTWRLTP